MIHGRQRQFGQKTDRKTYRGDGARADGGGGAKERDETRENIILYKARSSVNQYARVLPNEQ